MICSSCSNSIYFQTKAYQESAANPPAATKVQKHALHDSDDKYD
jgi:hypothetical protein